MWTCLQVIMKMLNVNNLLLEYFCMLLTPININDSMYKSSTIDMYANIHITKFIDFFIDSSL